MKKCCEVKICGLTRRCDLDAAIDAGADYLGFVCVESSKRFVSFEKLTELTAACGNRIRKVGVFQNVSLKHIRRIADAGKLDVIQLHGDESPEFAAALSRDIEVWKAFTLKNEADLTRAVEYPAARIVCDAPNGGSGTCCDWNWARRLNERKIPVVLAGGIRPENARAAWDCVGCSALDAASGVETAPGIKDQRKIEALIKALEQ